MDSIFVDSVNNDLAVDINGNLQIATGGFALALAAACAIRTFQSEVYYDSTQGLPYFQAILGKNPPLEYVRARLADAALNADPDIVASQVYFSSLTNRDLSGQVQTTDSTGKIAASNF